MQLAETATSSPGSYGIGLKILVVDDEPLIRRLARLALEAVGFEISMAEDGASALEAIRNDPNIALVLLDLTMPVMTGEQALPIIREMRPDLPIVLSSGYSDSEITEKFSQAGVHGFLQKPFRAEDLRRVVARAFQPAVSSQAG